MLTQSKVSFKTKDSYKIVTYPSEATIAESAI